MELGLHPCTVPLNDFTKEIFAAQAPTGAILISSKNHVLDEVAGLHCTAS